MAAELLDPVQLIAIFLVFVRISALFFAAPFFSHKAFPVRVRILLGVLLAWIMLGYVVPPPEVLIARPLGLVIAIATEVLTGLAIGMAAQFIFWSVQFASQVLGFQMGLAMAQIFDPASGQSTNPLGSLLSLGFLMVFVLLDGPHMILNALVVSFENVPLAQANISVAGPLMLGWAGEMFITGLRIASPFMITFFLVESAMGVFARVVPQADLFSLGLPLKLIIGLSLAIPFIQALFPLVGPLTEEMITNVLGLIEALGP